MLEALVLEDDELLEALVLEGDELLEALVLEDDELEDDVAIVLCTRFAEFDDEE
jgi:hypothetical protein|tara:strand:+ start:203 stop:364 length:162 start_codon:yes stop_codon:yes gene_type:complete